MAASPWQRLFPSLTEAGYLGCELRVFGYPQGNQFLRFPGGVTAIFGPNGVGKSRTLAALRNLITCSDKGHITERLYFTTDSTDHKAAGPFETGAAESTVRDFAAKAGIPTDRTIIEVASWFCSERDLRNSPEHKLVGGFNYSPGRPGLALEIARLKTFAVTPGLGGWVVAAAVPPDLKPGELRNELERTKELALTNYEDSLYGADTSEYPLVHSFDFDLLEALDDPSRPGWVPFPMEPVGTADMWGVAEVMDLDSRAGGLPIGLRSGSTQEERAARVRLVNEVFATLYMDAFPLSLIWGTPSDWFDHRAPRWEASPAMPDGQIRSPEDGEGLAFQDLSDTQRRWASFAIRLADKISSGQEKLQSWTETNEEERNEEPFIFPLMLTADEPERGMSLLAQRHLSRGMNKLHRTYGLEFFVATHSPAIIEDPSTNLVRAERDVHLHLCLTEVDPAETEVFENLGIPPWEHPQLYRVFLFVEGAHDEAVIDALRGGELAQLRVKILPLRGAGKHLSSIAADADFLATHTLADFVILIDNVNSKPFRQALELMRSGATGDDVDQYLQGHLTSTKSQEERTLHTLLVRLAESGRGDRLRGIVGLPVGDVIELLPSTLVSEKYTWSELRDQHANRGKGQAKDFKDWLRQRFKVDITPQLLSRAASDLDEIPAALGELLETCRSIVEVDTVDPS